MRIVRWVWLAAAVLVFFSFSVAVQLYRQTLRPSLSWPVTHVPVAPVTITTAYSNAAVLSSPSASPAADAPRQPQQQQQQQQQQSDPLIAFLRSNAHDVLSHATASASPWVRDMNRLSLSLAESLKSINEHTPHIDGPAFTLAPDRVVIVIMTYARPGYVQRLLESLAVVEGTLSRADART